jgi:heat shock protein HtpX
LNRLETIEIAGVTAHEISHIRNNDMRAMWFAMLLSRVTDLMSMAGQVLLFITLPIILLSQVTIHWLPIAVLIMAPSLSYLVQLGLSRVHEFKADLGSAEIMGSPEPLISALAKIEYGRPGFLGHWFAAKQSENDAILFRTHPPTAERIRRLKEVRPLYPALTQETHRAMNRRIPMMGSNHHDIRFI